MQVAFSTAWHWHVLFVQARNELGWAMHGSACCKLESTSSAQRLDAEVLSDNQKLAGMDLVSFSGDRPLLTVTRIAVSPAAGGHHLQSHFVASA